MNATEEMEVANEIAKKMAAGMKIGVIKLMSKDDVDLSRIPAIATEAAAGLMCTLLGYYDSDTRNACLETMRMAMLKRYGSMGSYAGIGHNLRPGDLTMSDLIKNLNGHRG